MATLKGIFNSIKKEGYVVKDLDMYLSSLSEKDENRAINVNAPSQIGGCLRARYYARKEVEPDSGSVDARTRRIFDNGSHVHLRIQDYLREMGMLLMDEVPVHNEQYNIQGHTDALLKLSPLEKGVLEIKSINSRGFTELKEAKPEHKEQALTYLYCLEERRKYLIETYANPENLEKNKDILFKFYASFYQHVQGGRKHTREEKIEFQCNLCWERDKILFETKRSLSKCILIYENKDDQSLKEFAVLRSPESKSIIDNILKECAYLNDCVIKEIVPERLCKNKSDQCGRWCNYKNTCFIL